MNPDIAIVAIGYNRPAALKRLLHSLSAASYDREVKLYISIDGGKEEGKKGRRGECHPDPPKAEKEPMEKGRRGECHPDPPKAEKEPMKKGRSGAEVRRIAEDFIWSFGEKKLIFHETNLGLRNHVLKCGDLSANHDAIIALEDDLVVSPGFFEFALRAFEFYSDDPKIAGISLYHHAYNETAQFPFVPRPDGTDVYFLQYASSWGQVWGKEQWRQFREWYESYPMDESNPPDESGGKSSSSKSLPENIRLWPDNSWKKFFIEFLIEKDLYFVYPRVSFTTLFGDEGTNIRFHETFLQVPLWYGKRPFIFAEFIGSSCVYDTWCEILPDRLKRLWPGMKDEDFDVDLYGMKFSSDIKSPKVISGRVCKDPEMTFGREMRPHEENLIWEVSGTYFHLGRKEDFSDAPYLARLFKCHEQKELSYWYPIREYHFHKNKILATKGNPYSPSNPGFLFKKAMTTAGYLLRYFFGVKG